MSELRKAAEDFVKAYEHCPDFSIIEARKDALKAVLAAEPEQEPAAWGAALAMANDSRIDAMIRNLIDNATEDNAVCLVREIMERTHPQRKLTEQKPFGFGIIRDDGITPDHDLIGTPEDVDFWLTEVKGTKVALYTHPQRKLTDEEMEELLDELAGTLIDTMDDVAYVLSVIERKLTGGKP